MTTKLLSPVTDRSAWRGKDYTDDASWAVDLSDEHLDEVRSAVQHVKAKGLKVTEVTREHFPLPTLARRLEAVLDELENGRGFALLRGLTSERFSDEEAAVGFWGIGAHLGLAISQNARGEVLASVEDKGYTYGEKDVRGYETSAKLRYHCDNCDIVGLFCVRPAKSGGTSNITSSMAIYNEILEHHPRYVDLLYRGFHHDLRGEQRDGVAAITERPVPIYSYFAGRLSCRYVGSTIRLAQNRTGVPFTQEEAAVLDLIEALAESDELRLDMQLRQGDMQFLNNHMVLHSRTDFEDFPEPDRKRKLLRLWLNMRNGRPLAPEFKNRFNAHAGMGIPAKA